MLTIFFGAICITMNKPISGMWLAVIWISCWLVVLAVVLRHNRRLIELAWDWENVSQRLDGTGYKKTGRDLALVIPFKNKPKHWWHSPIPSSVPITAHIEFLDEKEEMALLTCYAGCWLNCRGPTAHFAVGETRELVIALQETLNARSMFIVPEMGAPPSDGVKQLVDAFSEGSMLTLKELGPASAVYRVNVHLSGQGYLYTKKYIMKLRGVGPALEELP
jgi:hypothetical protein